MHPIYSAGCRALLLLLTTACAPTYLLALKPAQATGLFAEGHEQAWNAADSVEVRLHFLAYEPDRLVYNVEYRNSSSRPLLVDPAAFQYVPTRQPGPGLPAGQAPPKVPHGAAVSATEAARSQYVPLPPLPATPVAAFDPEPQINALHDEAGREAARAARIDWFGVALLVGSVALDVASIGKNETPAQAKSRAATQESVAAYQVFSAANKVRHAITADVLAGQAAALQDFALRKTTLAPGQQVRGYLYFPRFDSADGLRVSAPINGQRVPLEFVQTRVRR